MSQTPQRRCDCATGAAIRLFAARDYITGDQFEIIQCSNCGLAFTHPVPEDLARYYPESYYGSPEGSRFPPIVERLQKMLYASRAEDIERLAGGKPGKILDIGCGRGFLLQAFQRLGWEVTGTEMSEPAAVYAREKLKLPVHIGKIEEFKLPANSFDAAVMWHVLEHLERPNDALRETHRLLRSGGALLAATPNFDSREARLMRDKWFHLDVPRHLTHFTERTLSRCLVRNGFQIERVSRRALEYDWFSVTQSFLNRIGLDHNWLYNALRQRGARTTAGGTLKQALAHCVGVPLAATAGFGLLVNSGGSTLIFYARKV